jgi:hypothetical protein
MWSKIFDPYAYGNLGMKENTYLVVAILLIGFFSTWIIKNKILPSIKNNRIILIYGEILLFSIMIPLVIIFLRPINQFIYFQF